MPYASNNGTRIYYETEGAGPPLVLHHGTAGSCADWRDLGYTEALGRNHRLILIDARGHGASDKPHDPAAYDLALRVADVTAVLDELRLPAAHFLGYSMGGWIGFGMAKHAPERLASLILGGAHPYADSMRAFRNLMPPDIDRFLAVMEQFFGAHMTPALRARLARSDLKALAALTQDRASLADILPTMRMPCLLFAGDADPRSAQVQACAKSLPDATFFSVPDAGHVAAICRSDLVVSRVGRFLGSRASSQG